jgi:hypothetical protein
MLRSTRDDAKFSLVATPYAAGAAACGPAIAMALT